jgi:hypothetical protein
MSAKLTRVLDGSTVALAGRESFACQPCENMHVFYGAPPLQARSDVAVCLVTGNLEPIGWGKMEALGISQLFTEPRFGGFGSDFCSGDTLESWRDRGQLVRIAAERAEKLSSGARRASCRCRTMEYFAVYMFNTQECRRKTWMQSMANLASAT